MSALKLYFRYIGISLRSQMQYKASFIMLSIGHFFVTLVEFFGVWILFDRFGAIRGWSLEEIALFYGITHTAFSLAEAGARGFDIFHRQVKSGNFDRMLLRPRSTVLQVIGQEFQLLRVGRFAQGLLILYWALSQLQDINLWKILLLLSSIIGGALLYAGLFVLQATLSFWSVESLEMVNMFTYGGVETTQFPLSIYDSWFRKFFVFVIPLAFVNYFPALGILGRKGFLDLPRFFYWASPLVGFLFFLATVRIWKFGIRYYRSTGS